jgi:ABC-2 type transport system ATP-binding protein
VAIISRGTVITTDTVDNLLSNRERVVWCFHPLEKGKEVLRSVTTIEEREDGTISTEYNEMKIAEWNKILVESGVSVTQMYRKMPVLEDLFLELTGGDSIE